MRLFSDHGSQPARSCGRQFALGQSKISVMSAVGGAIATTPDGLNSFDLYKLLRVDQIGSDRDRHRAPSHAARRLDQDDRHRTEKRRTVCASCLLVER
jgi:hypothetical protein